MIFRIEPSCHFEKCDIANTATFQIQNNLPFQNKHFSFKKCNRRLLWKRSKSQTFSNDHDDSQHFFCSFVKQENEKIVVRDCLSFFLRFLNLFFFYFFLFEDRLYRYRVCREFDDYFWVTFEALFKAVVKISLRLKPNPHNKA